LVQVALLDSQNNMGMKYQLICLTFFRHKKTHDLAASKAFFQCCSITSLYQNRGATKHDMQPLRLLKLANSQYDKNLPCSIYKAAIVKCLSVDQN